RRERRRARHVLRRIGYRRRTKEIDLRAVHLEAREPGRGALTPRVAEPIGEADQRFLQCHALTSPSAACPPRAPAPVPARGSTWRPAGSPRSTGTSRTGCPPTGGSRCRAPCRT